VQHISSNYHAFNYDISRNLNQGKHGMLCQNITTFKVETDSVLLHVYDRVDCTCREKPKNRDPLKRNTRLREKIEKGIFSVKELKALEQRKESHSAKKAKLNATEKPFDLWDDSSKQGEGLFQQLVNTQIDLAIDFWSVNCH